WRKFLQTSDDRGSDRRGLSSQFRTSPLHQSRGSLHFIELLDEGMMVSDAQLVLIEGGDGPGNGAHCVLRVAALKEKLLQGRALSLLQHQGAQLVHIGNGPDYRIRALMGAKAIWSAPVL